MYHTIIHHIIYVLLFIKYFLILLSDKIYIIVCEVIILKTKNV